MTSSQPSSDSRFARAELVLGEYLEQQELGYAPPFSSLLAAHPDIADELRQLGQGLPALSQGFDAEAKRATTEREEVERLLSTLAAPGAFQDRYVLESEVGQGGMGIVYRVRDRKLDRPLALKVIRGKATAIPTGQTPAIAPRQLVRFLNEAKITGQLDHPGIVPVHEVGVDQQGRAYFTMKLVKGRTLADVLKLRAAGDEHWTLPRVLGVIQRVCEAVAFAHERGVIHRDLKPANVMVGDFGEVYVMDWGLARRTSDALEPASRETEAAIEEELAPEATLTRDGDQVGTPAYMSPEQAYGKIEEMGPSSDVYSIGAMLYELIAGTPPYVKKGESTSGAMILTRVIAGPPPALVSQETPPELIAICQRAMARERNGRYAHVRDLAEDLERFLSGRTVRAFRTGAWIETRKWVERNRPLAISLAGGFLVLVLGVVYSTIKTRDANQKANDVLSLSAIQELRGLEAEAAQLWPAVRENVPRYDDWIARARVMIEGRATDEGPGKPRHPSVRDHEAKLAELRHRALPRTVEQTELDRQRSPWFEEWRSARAELSWRRRMLGLEPWPDIAAAGRELDNAPASAFAFDADAELWKLVKPDRSSTTFGQEIQARVRATRRIDSSKMRDEADVRETLAWACFQSGELDSALDEARRVRAATRDEDVLRSIDRLESAVQSWRSADGRIHEQQTTDTLAARVEHLGQCVDTRQTLEFERQEDAWWHEQLMELVDALHEFDSEAAGHCGLFSSGVSPTFGWGIVKRLQAARVLDGETVGGAEVAGQWSAALAYVATDEHYSQAVWPGGGTLRPQRGLVPLGPDPDSHLLEFWHVQSGAEPKRDAAGKLVRLEDMGLVFVLLPGGQYTIGAQFANPTGRNYDQDAGIDEPLAEVVLDAYFLSKFEMTQAQWLRLAGSNPSTIYPGLRGANVFYRTGRDEATSLDQEGTQGESAVARGIESSLGWLVRGPNELGLLTGLGSDPLRPRWECTWLHPVETVSWEDCTRLFEKFELCLPTEAQWEVGCRGGTDTPWWTGPTPASLAKLCNLADLSARRQGSSWRSINPDGNFEDGFAVHAPIGNFPANPYGLHDLHGNVAEWCKDLKSYLPTDKFMPGDGERISTAVQRYHAVRDASYRDSAQEARVTHWYSDVPSMRSSGYGVRPARRVFP